MNRSTLRKAALAATAIVVVVGGGAWGVGSYRTAQVTAQAEEAAQSLQSSLEASESAVQAYEAALNDADQRTKDELRPVLRLVTKHSKAFGKDERGALGSRVDVLDGLVGDPAATTLEIQAPFDAEDLEQHLVQEYRQADRSGREELEEAGGALVERIDDWTAELQEATAALATGVTQAEEAAIQVAQSAQKRLKSWEKSHGSASKKSKDAARRAAKVFSTWDELSDEDRPARVAELGETLPAFVKARSAVRTSHEKSVAAARAARAAQRPAAATPASGGPGSTGSSGSGSAGSGSSAGGGGGSAPQTTRMCSRYVGSATGVGQLMLLPC